MLLLPYDLRRLMLVRGATDSTVLILPTFVAGASYDLTALGLLPTGDPTSPYAGQTITGARLSFCTGRGSAAQSLVSVALLDVAGQWQVGVTLPTTGVVPAGSQYIDGTLVADITTTEGGPYHVETSIVLRDSSFPISVPESADADLLTADDIGTGPGTVAAGDDVRIVNASRDYVGENNQAFASRVAASAFSADKVNLFNNLGPTPTWNPTRWCADVNLTCFSPYNTRGGGAQGGCLITPRHVALANHFSNPTTGTNPMVPGTTTITFVGADNTPYVRTITALTQAGTSDVLVGTLDSDLPAVIRPAKYLPVQRGSFFGANVTALVTNQYKQAHLATANLLVGIGNTQVTPITSGDLAAWSTNPLVADGASGSPIFFLVNGEVYLDSVFHSTNYGDNVGVQIAAINAIVGPQYALNAPTFSTTRDSSAYRLNDDATFKSVAAGTVGATLLDLDGPITVSGGDPVALAVLCVDSSNNAALIVLGGGQALRVKADGSGFEAYTPSTGGGAFSFAGLVKSSSAGGPPSAATGADVAPLLIGLPLLPTYPAISPLISDSFTGADGTLATAHSGESGTTWTLPTGGASGVLSNNRLVLKGGALRSTFAPTSADYVVSAQVYKFSNPAGQCAICARMSADGQTFYWLTLNGANQVGLYKFVAGANSQVALGSKAFNAGETHTLALMCIGSTITPLWDGAPIFTPITDTSIVAPGTAGFFGGDPADDASHGVHIDSLSVTPTKTQVVIGLGGDSIATDTRGAAAFKAYLESQLYDTTVTVLNQGVPGSATGDWLPNSSNLNAAEAAWNQSAATSVVFNLGTNDSKVSPATSAATFQSNILSIANHVLANVATCQRVTFNVPTYPVPGSYSSSWDANSPLLVRQYGRAISKLDNGTTIRRGSMTALDNTRVHPELQEDGIHFNDAGYQLLGVDWALAWLNPPTLTP